MLKLDFSAFDRMLNNALNGNTNVFDLRAEFSSKAPQPSVTFTTDVTQAANADRVPLREVG